MSQDATVALLNSLYILKLHNKHYGTNPILLRRRASQLRNGRRWTSRSPCYVFEAGTTCLALTPVITAVAKAVITIRWRQSEDLADVFIEANDRGPAWKEAIRKSMDQIEDNTRERIQAALADGTRKLDRDPAEFDIAGAAANITSG